MGEGDNDLKHDSGGLPLSSVPRGCKATIKNPMAGYEQTHYFG